jgi:hypothetical protein
MTELFRIGVDVEAELREDGDPHVIWSHHEMVMMIVRGNGGIDETILALTRIQRRHSRIK